MICHVVRTRNLVKYQLSSESNGMLRSSGASSGFIGIARTCAPDPICFCGRCWLGALEQNGLVADDGQRQTWAIIRSGLSTGLLRPVDLDAEDGPPGRRRRRKGEQP
jgi:hypothetical protein